MSYLDRWGLPAPQQPFSLGPGPQLGYDLRPAEDEWERRGVLLVNRRTRETKPNPSFSGGEPGLGADPNEIDPRAPESTWGEIKKGLLGPAGQLLDPDVQASLKSGYAGGASMLGSALSMPSAPAASGAMDQAFAVAQTPTRDLSLVPSPDVLAARLRQGPAVGRGIPGAQRALEAGSPGVDAAGVLDHVLGLPDDTLSLMKESIDKERERRVAEAAAGKGPWESAVGGAVTDLTAIAVDPLNALPFGDVGESLTKPFMGPMLPESTGALRAELIRGTKPGMAFTTHTGYNPHVPLYEPPGPTAWPHNLKAKEPLPLPNLVDVDPETVSGAWSYLSRRHPRLAAEVDHVIGSAEVPIAAWDPSRRALLVNPARGELAIDTMAHEMTHVAQTARGQRLGAEPNLFTNALDPEDLARIREMESYAAKHQASYAGVEQYAPRPPENLASVPTDDLLLRWRESAGRDLPAVERYKQRRLEVEMARRPDITPEAAAEIRESLWSGGGALNETDLQTNSRLKRAESGLPPLDLEGTNYTRKLQAAPPKKGWLSRWGAGGADEAAAGVTHDQRADKLLDVLNFGGEGREGLAPASRAVENLPESVALFPENPIDSKVVGGHGPLNPDDPFLKAIREADARRAMPVESAQTSKLAPTLDSLESALRPGGVGPGGRFKPSEAGFIGSSAPPPPVIPELEPMRKYMGEARGPGLAAKLKELPAKATKLAENFYTEMINLDAPVERLGKRKAPLMGPPTASGQMGALGRDLFAGSGMKQEVVSQVQSIRGASTLAERKALSLRDADSMRSVWQGTPDHEWDAAEAIMAAERHLEIADNQAAGVAEHQADVASRAAEVKRLRQEAVDQRRSVRGLEAQARQLRAEELKAARREARAGGQLQVRSPALQRAETAATEAADRLKQVEQQLAARTAEDDASFAGMRDAQAWADATASRARAGLQRDLLGEAFQASREAQNASFGAGRAEGLAKGSEAMARQAGTADSRAQRLLQEAVAARDVAMAKKATGAVDWQAARDAARAKLNEAIMAGRSISAGDAARLRSRPAPVLRSSYPDADIWIDHQASVDAVLARDVGKQKAFSLYPGLETKIEGSRKWQVENIADRYRDAGFLSDEGYDALIHKGQAYIPELRVERELEEAGGAVGSTRANPLRRLHAGLSEEDKILHPIDSLLQRAHQAELIAQQQKLRNTIADFADQYPDVFPDIRPAEVHGPTMGRSAETFPVWRKGVKVEYTAPKDVLAVANQLGPHELTGAFKLAHKMASYAGHTMRAGVTSGLEFAFYRNPLFDQFDAIVNSKAGYNPSDFVRGLYHIFRKTDAYEAAMKSGGDMAFLTALDRTAAVARGADVRAGADLSGYISSAARHYKDAVFPKSGNLFGIPGDVLGRQGRRGFAPTNILLHPLQNAQMYGELPTRVGGYLAARDPTVLNKAVRKAENLFVPQAERVGMGDLGEAAGRSGMRENTLDFARHGRSGALANGPIAFFNAELQGWDRFARAVKARPGPTLFKAVALLTIPSVIHWQLQHSDPEWEKQYSREPEWRKAMFYRLPLPNGGSVPIPRGRGIVSTIFGYGAEKILDAVFEQDPDAARAMASQILQDTPVKYAGRLTDQGFHLSPAALIPTAIKPELEVAMNYDLFRNAPVETDRQEGVLPEDRYSASTPPSLQVLSKEFGGYYSPVQLQHLVRGHLGTLGQYGVGLADKFVGSDLQQLPPETQLPAPLGWVPTDAPLLRGLIQREPVGYGSQPVTDFYNLLDRATQAHGSTKKAESLPAPLVPGSTQRDTSRYKERAGEIRTDYPEVDYYAPLAATAKAIGALHKQQDYWRTRPETEASPEEIRQHLHQLDQQITALAEQTLASIRAGLSRSAGQPSTPQPSTPVPGYQKRWGNIQQQPF